MYRLGLGLDGKYLNYMNLGLGQGRDRDQNFSTCWDLLQAGFKFYFVLEVVLSLLSYFLGGLFILFPNIVAYTVQSVQLWRIFTSFLLPGAGSFAVINVLFDFYILYMCMPEVEKKNSTAYILLEVPLQITLINLVLVIIGYPLYYFNVVGMFSLISYGMQPVLFYFIWTKVAQNPEQPTRFCFFPCLIPMKYIPLCLLALLMIFGSPMIPLIIYCLVGYYQTMVIKRSIFRLPLSVYRKVDSLMPASTKEQPGYIKVISVQSNLRKVCLSGGCCQWGSQADNNPFNNERQNPYVSSSSQPGNQDRVEVIGGGVAIGGSGFLNPQNETNFKNYWNDKNGEEQQQGKYLRQAGQNRQILQSDQRFQYNQLNSKPLTKTANDTEIDNQREMSHAGLKSEENEEPDLYDRK